MMNWYNVYVFIYTVHIFCLHMYICTGLFYSLYTYTHKNFIVRLPVHWSSTVLSCQIWYIGYHLGILLPAGFIAEFYSKSQGRSVVIHNIMPCLQTLEQHTKQVLKIILWCFCPFWIANKLNAVSDGMHVVKCCIWERMKYAIELAV